MAHKGMLVNKQHFCELIGITKYQFEKYVAAGMPVHQRPVNKQDEYLVFVGDCVEWMVKNASASAVGQRGEGQRSFEEERIRLTAEQADAVALKNAQARGELVPVADVVMGWQAAVGRSRGMMLGIPTSAAPRVVQLVHGFQDRPDAAERAVREHLVVQIDAAMAELQNTSVDEPDEDEEDGGPPPVPGDEPLARISRPH